VATVAGEIDSAADGFVDAVFRLDGDVRTPPCPLTKRDYVARALRGGYPEAVRRDPGRRRARFFDSYVTDLVTRDVQQISDIERPAEMRRLLSVVAARMGTLAVIQSMANDVALPRQTLSRYLDLLELIFVIKRIPAWSSNLTTRAISTPKLIVTDSGLGGRLIGMSEERAKDPTAPVGRCWRTSRSARSRDSSPGPKSQCSFSTTVTAIRWRWTWCWSMRPAP
jgi:hypothetical protein